MHSEDTSLDASGGAENPREHKEDDEDGLLDKARDRLTVPDEEAPPAGSGTQQHQPEGAPPPGEEPTTGGYDSPKTGPA